MERANDQERASRAPSDPAVERGAAGAPSQAQSDRIDAIQDEVMARESVDGRPPPRRVRLAEWYWLGILAPVALLAVAGWVFNREIHARTVLLAIVLIVALVGAAAPVWGAGLMRGSEERTARRRAQTAAGVQAPRPLREDTKPAVRNTGRR